MFRDLETLQKLIKQYCTGRELDNLKKKKSNETAVDADPYLSNSPDKEKDAAI